MGHAVIKDTKYQIVNARVEVCSGGPDPSILVAEVELMPQTAKGKPIFYTLSEAEGMPAFYKTKESVFDKLMNPDEDEDIISDSVDTHDKVMAYKLRRLFRKPQGHRMLRGAPLPNLHHARRLGRRQSLYRGLQGQEPE